MSFKSFAITTSCVLFLSLTGAPPAHGAGTPASGTVTDELICQESAGSAAAVGDFIAAEPDGLNEAYHYYIEVPPGQTDLEIEIFDADILAGVDDESDERDRERGSDSDDSVARYQLFDPAGNLMATRFATGDENGPAGSDDAWITFFDNETSGITGGDTFADNFTTAAYNNNDGSDNFAGDWIETNDLGGGGATGGDILITGGELSIDNDSDSTPFNNQPSIEREIDLTDSAWVAVNLSFDYRTTAGIDDSDALVLEISDDGGSTWEFLENFTGADYINDSGSRSYDITEFIAADTRIRFRVHAFYAGTNETFFVDNFEVRATTTANGPDPDAGHWQLVVDMSENLTLGDDVNAFGLRAHDGDATSGGTEYNAYADSFFIGGINDNARSRDYDLYPYITSGCDADVNDFDWDGDAPNPAAPNPNTQPFGSLAVTSRSGSYSNTNGDMSDNDAWQSTNFSGWTTSDTVGDYGIWALDLSIEATDAANYGLVYFGAHDAADPDANGDGSPGPSAQPEADTFRIYLPTDAAAAPAKPHLSQLAAYVEDQSSGPNPPTVGNTSRYAVSLVMTNPSGSIGGITFSTTDLVTALVPGGVARYGGVAFITAGSVVAQPTVGQAAAADITWNPGTLSPGDEEILTYFVDVSPTAAVDIDVTGTPGSGDGTRATYVDETGDTTNARATYTFGELCELTVETAAATPVLVSSFSARAQHGALVLEWSTAAEAGIAELELLRQEAGGLVPVGPRPLLAQLTAPQGGVYRLADPAVSPRGAHTYWLREIEAGGRSRLHGPFTVEARDGPAETAGALDPDTGSRRPHEPPDAARRRRLAAWSERAAADRAATDRASGALKIAVGEPGLYRAPADEIAPLLGLSLDGTLKLLAGQRLALSVGGEPVAWQRAADGQALEFYGESVESPYTTENVYRLARGAGLAMPALAGQPPAEVAPGSFRDRLRFEQNNRPLVLVPLDPESDFWFWDFLRHGDPSHGSKSFELTVPDPAAARGTATLTVWLQGAAAGVLHTLDVSVGGSFAGQVHADGLESSTATVELPQGWLVDGTNSIELTAVAGGLVFLDAFELSYERLYRAAGDRLASRGEELGTVAVDGFTRADVQVFNLRDPRRPVRLAGVRTVPEGGGYRALFIPANGTDLHLAVSPEGVRRPLRLTADRPSRLLSPENRADYLILTTRELLAAAGRLAEYRQQRGLETMVVDLEDVYDELRHGLAEPRAIGDFLLAAATTWSVAPRFVVLAGAGTYDHADHLGLGGNLIPPRMLRRGDTLFASDLPHADLVGGDGVPEMAIGRIPALSAAELAAYVEKVIAYESLADPDSASRVLLLADHPDGFGDFPGQSDQLAALLPPGYDTQTIALPDYPDLDAARQDLFTALDSGVAALSYIGHGGLDRLGSQGLLTSADVPLGNRIQPIVTSLTCHIALFALPGFDALGEHLVLEESGGAVAVWAPVWLSQHPQALVLGDRLYRQLYQRGEPILGIAIRRAMADAAAAGVPAELLSAYHLLGDPALELRLAPRPPSGEGEPGGDG